jgi:flagellin
MPKTRDIRMTSINTNLGAIAALQSLRSVNSILTTTQEHVSSGLRISKAADNAAYWSISTTMRSDNRAISSVSDALGFAAAKVETGYTALNSVVDILGEFKAKLVTANEASADKSKIQGELNQLKQQVLSISQSAAFSGVNYLSTDIDDIFDDTQNRASVVSSFTRDDSGAVSVKSADFNLQQISLFNSTGGGILQPDPRDLKTIGGLRYIAYNNSTEYRSTSAWENTGGRGPADQTFMFTGPFTIGASDTISFDIIVDAENPDPVDPDNQLPGGYDSGSLSHVVIDRGLIDTYFPAANGVVSDYEQYTSLISHAMDRAGAGVNADVMNYTEWDPPNQTVTWKKVIDRIGFNTSAASGRPGLSIQITNVGGTIPAAGLADRSPNYAYRDSAMNLSFEQFRVYDDVVVSFRFGIDDEPTQLYSFDKDYVNNLLGIDDGKVSTPDDMATLLNALINRPDIIITSDGVGSVNVKTDVNVNRNTGWRSGIGFSGINVNIEPIPTLSFMDIDIDANPNQQGTYLNYIEVVSQKAIQGASALGSVQKRIGLQMEFTGRLMDSINSGIGRLVDADMEQESSRLAAEQAQQQLAIQSLSIANQQPQTLLSLFRN